MPKIKPDPDHCTCAYLSYYGKGHATACAASIIAELRGLVATAGQKLFKERFLVLQMKEALRTSNSYIENGCELHTKHRTAGRSIIKHIRKLIRT